MNLFSEISEHIAINHIMLKLDFVDYIFVPDTVGLCLTNVTLLAPKAAEFGRIRMTEITAITTFTSVIQGNRF